MVVLTAEKTPSTACTPKRKAFMLPLLVISAKKCWQIYVGIPTAGLRKEEMIDRLYQADNAAVFGHPTRVTSLGSEELLVACVKARILSTRYGKNIDGLDFWV